MTPDPTIPVCHRCGVELTPNGDAGYIVRIEAFADPTPPPISEEDLRGDLEGEIEQLLEGMRGIPEPELMDQVHRRLTIRLCGPCYRRWIEDPAG